MSARPIQVHFRNLSIIKKSNRLPTGQEPKRNRGKNRKTSDAGDRNDVVEDTLMVGENSSTNGTSSSRPADVKIGGGIRLAVFVYLVLASIMTAWACVDLQKFYAAVGMLSFAITIMPFLVIKRYDIFSPWSFVLLAVFLGNTMQCICMSFNWPTESYIDQMLLLGKPVEYFYYPAALFLMSFVLFTLGYFLPIKFKGTRFKFRREFDPKRTFIVVGCCLCLAMASTFLYVRNTGGLSSGRISDKRTTIKSVDVSSDKDLQQYGYLKQISKFAPAGFLVLYSFILSRQNRLNLFARGFLLMVFLVAIAMPFYASSRSDVAWLFIGAMGVAYYHHQKAVFRNIALLALAGASMFVMMSFLRHTDTNEVWENASFTDAGRSLVLNRNGPGLSKTSHVINHVPDPLNFQYGKTIAVWAIAPIPRAIYPSKPLIHSGPIIGTTIYGTKVSGVPPGLIGEMYWNFHIAGIIFGMFVVGLGLRLMYEVFWNSNTNRAVLIPIYLFALITVGYAVLGHSLGYGVVAKAIDFVTVAIVVLPCTRRARS